MLRGLLLLHCMLGSLAVACSLPGAGAGCCCSFLVMPKLGRGGFHESHGKEIGAFGTSKPEIDFLPYTNAWA